MEPIKSPLELYAHAIAIEREAAERYDELSWHMSDLGNELVAALFERLGACRDGRAPARKHGGSERGLGRVR